jgi:hypothetical protein
VGSVLQVLLVAFSSESCKCCVSSLQLPRYFVSLSLQQRDYVLHSGSPSKNMLSLSRAHCGLAMVACSIRSPTPDKQNVKATETKLVSPLQKRVPAKPYARPNSVNDDLGFSSFLTSSVGNTYSAFSFWQLIADFRTYIVFHHGCVSWGRKQTRGGSRDVPRPNHSAT